MKKHWISLACFMALATAIPLRAQSTGNMIHNPSFEEHRRCPMKIDATGVMRDADAWWQPTNGSSDYFNACGSRDCNVPRNKMGLQEAHSGMAYCGIYCSQELYREYLQTELITPLQAGKHYRISFWVSLADKSPHAVAAIGAVLTKEILEDSTHGILMEREQSSIDGNGSQSIAVYFVPQVSNPVDSVLDDTKGWTEVSGEITAEGGERYLTIGNFLPFNKSNIIATQGTSTPLPGAYYYIDDVSVICLDTTEDVTPEPKKKVTAGEVVTMQNIFFATGESEILQQSYNELYKLRKILESNPEMRIELRGHTDNQGTVVFNQRLSESRAQAVAEYLMEKGIDSQRLTWIGFGKSKPVADNNTAEGRCKNRRVEYRVLAD